MVSQVKICNIFWSSHFAKFQILAILTQNFVRLNRKNSENHSKIHKTISKHIKLFLFMMTSTLITKGLSKTYTMFYDTKFILDLVKVKIRNIFSAFLIIQGNFIHINYMIEVILYDSYAMHLSVCLSTLIHIV